jgi:ABC-2 type transport system permease protein
MTTTHSAHLPTVLGPMTVCQPLSRRPRDDVAAVPAAIRSEWIKLRSLRSTPAILVLAVVVGLLLSWILATFVKTDPDTHEIFTVAQTFIFSTWLTTVMTVIMGTLLFTSEVQHGTLAAVVAAQPARWVTVVAKAAVASCFGLVLGVAGMAAGLGGAVLGGLEAGDTSGVATTALWGLLLTAMAPLLGLGVGLIIRHSSAAISIVLVWAFVLENLIVAFTPANLTRFLPFSAAPGLLGVHEVGSTPETVAVALSRVQDAFLFAGYSLAALALGAVLLYRRDTD